MAPDVFTETTTKGWGERLRSSLMGLLIGPVLFIAGFPLLFWNEGRAVNTAKTIEEGAASVVSVTPNRIDPACDKKLVHVTGLANTEDALADDQFGVKASAIKLLRKVEMYQWEEEKETKTQRRVGGKEETTTTYRYVQKWLDEPEESSHFKDPQGHANPPMPLRSAELTARNVGLGAFRLTDQLIARIDKADPLPVGEPELAALPSALRNRTALSGASFYLPAGAGPASASAPAAAPAQPHIGDLRVSFRVVRPCDVSVVARQVGSTFEPYTAKTGKDIELLKVGTHSAASMFADEARSNTVITWLLRAAGLLAMVIGIAMVFSLLATAADVLPFLGDVVRIGAGLAALVIALPCALVTIAIAWLFYRPLVGIPLLLAAGAAVIFGVRAIRARKARAAAQQA